MSYKQLVRKYFLPANYYFQLTHILIISLYRERGWTITERTIKTQLIHQLVFARESDYND